MNINSTENSFRLIQRKTVITYKYMRHVRTYVYMVFNPHI